MLFLGLYLLVGVGVFFYVDLPVARFFRYDGETIKLNHGVHAVQDLAHVLAR